ncbi:hypothetical protein ACQKO5_19200 [Novosphingobium subterraneum]|uniref:hypothetical protein n=1 Tax=Novosphingobium subterraneum TaxID=48936 RepID=UPI003CFBD024
MHIATHWLIVLHDGAEVGQIPLNPEYGMIRDKPGSVRSEAVRLQHIKLLEEHKDMAPGSQIKLQDGLLLKRVSAQ